MRTTKLGIGLLAVAAILAVGTAWAATQLYVQSPFKYKGHWVFNTATGADVTIRVQNTSATATPVRIEFSARLVNPTPTEPTAGFALNELIPANSTREFSFSLARQVSSLNFIRIRRLTP